MGMTKKEMELALLAIGERLGVVTPKAERPAAAPAPAPAAAPTDDAKAKRLAGLEKARAAKAAKRAAEPAKPAAAKAEAPAAKPAAAAVKGRKTATFTGNGQSVEVESDEKGYAVLHAVVNGKRVKLGAPVRLSSWRVLCCVIRSAAVQDMDKFMVENGLCDRDIA